MTRRLGAGLGLLLFASGVCASDCVAQTAQLPETPLIRAVSTALNTAFGKNGQHNFHFDLRASLAHIGRDSVADAPRWQRELVLPRGARMGHVRDYFECPDTKITAACRRTATGGVVYLASVDPVTTTSLAVRVILLNGTIGGGTEGMGVDVIVQPAADGQWTHGQVTGTVAW